MYSNVSKWSLSGKIFEERQNFSKFSMSPEGNLKKIKNKWGGRSQSEGVLSNLEISSIRDFHTSNYNTIFIELDFRQNVKQYETIIELENNRRYCANTSYQIPLLFRLSSDPRIFRPRPPPPPRCQTHSICLLAPSLELFINIFSMFTLCLRVYILYI